MRADPVLKSTENDVASQKIKTQPFGRSSPTEEEEGSKQFFPPEQIKRALGDQQGSEKN